MKKTVSLLIVVIFFMLGNITWSQCPEDPDDHGICDTIYVEPWPDDLQYEEGAGPYFVRVPIYVTNDVPDPATDSISGFSITLCYRHSNPSKYCSVSSYWNEPNLPPWDMERSIFRHLEISPSPGDTIFNRLADIAASEPGAGWSIIELDLDGTSHFWITMTPTTQQYWGEGSKVLLATMTFKLEDSMTIWIDTCIWPPSARLFFIYGGLARDAYPRPGNSVDDSTFEWCFNFGPYFTIGATPDTQTVQPGQSADYEVILTSLFGFASPCTLTATGLPDDASADFDPNPVTPTDTSLMTISTAETTPTGTHEITIIATELAKAQIEDSTQVVLIVTSSNVREIEISDEGRPSEFFLSQNYPNPFNPVTNFRFSLPKSAQVKIEIFNIVGQKVRTLVDQDMKPGVYVADWNGRDEKGNSVSSGIYFYRMQAGEFSDMKKMVLVK